MSETIEQTPSAELVKQAVKAIGKALIRIKENENIRYHMGAGTETFDCLVNAYAAIKNESPKILQNAILKYPLQRRSDTEILREIRDIVDSDEWRWDRQAACDKIQTLVRG